MTVDGRKRCFRHADGLLLLQCFGVFLSCVVCVLVGVGVSLSLAARRGGFWFLGWFGVRFAGVVVV